MDLPSLPRPGRFPLPADHEKEHGGNMQNLPPNQAPSLLFGRFATCLHMQDVNRQTSQAFIANADPSMEKGEAFDPKALKWGVFTKMKDLRELTRCQI